jgi:hypothetical protein
MTTKPFLKLLVVAAITFSLASCKKDRADAVDEIETTFEISENQAMSDNIDQDAGDVTEESAARNGLLGLANVCGSPTFPNWIGACATVTVTGNFPSKNIKIDFGTGCTGPNGRIRKGIINIVLTDSLYRPGSVATITFDNYFVNGYKREGTIIRTNTTVLGSGTRSHNRTVTNGKITAPDGRVWTHSCNLTITQIAGVLTPCDWTDDVYTIQGTRTVTNAQGRTRTATTQTPLQKKVSCSNIDQGILRIEGPNHFAIIDFGNGTCDNLATISVAGRPARTITLR